MHVCTAERAAHIQAGDLIAQVLLLGFSLVPDAALMLLQAADLALAGCNLVSQLLSLLGKCLCPGICLCLVLLMLLLQHNTLNPSDDVYVAKQPTADHMLQI